VAKGLDGKFILHLGTLKGLFSITCLNPFSTAPKFTNMCCVVPIAEIDPLATDHRCGGLRLMQAIAADSSAWASRLGGQVDAYLLDWACSAARCGPWLDRQAMSTSTSAVPPQSPAPSSVTMTQDEEMPVSLCSIMCYLDSLYNYHLILIL
jgi:hypothetical protein